MSVRLWYPQLDVYDTIRRMGALLADWQLPPPSSQRLAIIDFYFANPAMLHSTHMPAKIRQSFTQLKVPRPSSSFLSYPSAPVLFNQMEPIQKEAIRTLIGKELLRHDTFDKGSIEASDAGLKFFKTKMAPLVTVSERPLLHFLVQQFARISFGEPGGLKKNTGLWRIGP